MQTSEYFIQRLNMTAHPEGGHYKEVYRNAETITDKELSFNFEDTRPLATSIYFLLRSGEVSHFHKLVQDELWYYHGGSPLTVSVIHPNGTYQEHHIGPDLDAGQSLQAIIPGGSIFGSWVHEPDTYSLVGCVVTPGFDFRDFQLYKTSELLALYPAHEEIIRKLTKEVYG